MIDITPLEKRTSYQRELEYRSKESLIDLILESVPEEVLRPVIVALHSVRKDAIVFEAQAKKQMRSSRVEATTPIPEQASSTPSLH